MVDSKYGVAYSEVLEILKHIPIEDYNKIPKTKIDLFETYSNKDHTFVYDPNKTLEEQNVSNITKGIIILLFRDYWATEIQRKKIIAKQNYDRMKLEEEKKAKYNGDIFKKKENTEIKEEVLKDNSNNLPMEVKREKFYKKIIKFFKNIFHIN